MIDDWMSLSSAHSRWTAGLMCLLAVGCIEGDIGESAGSAGPSDAADAGPEPVACEEGLRNFYDRDTGACYMFFDARSTWQSALAACASLGLETHLATVTGQVEVAALQVIGDDAVDVWLGATDAEIEGDFVWITGEDLAFANWRSGEPNDGNSPIRREDCMIQEVDNGGTWDDRDCDSRYPYFCERR